MRDEPLEQKPDRVVLALTYEREQYLASGRPARILPVDESLAELGWCVDADGQLVRVDEQRRAVPEPDVDPAPETTALEAPPETTAEPKPRRGRPKTSQE